MTVPRCAAVVPVGAEFVHDCPYRGRYIRGGLHVCGTHRRYYDWLKQRRRGDDAATRAAVRRLWCIAPEGPTYG